MSTPPTTNQISGAGFLISLLCAGGGCALLGLTVALAAIGQPFANLIYSFFGS